MQVGVLESFGNTRDVFYALTHPKPHAGTLEYIQNQFSNFSNNLGTFGNQFVQSAKQMYYNLNDSSILRKAEVAIRKAGAVVERNFITKMDDLKEMRNANHIMQRYIMAQPDLREKYHKQTVDGYSDTGIHGVDVYGDAEPGCIGDTHLDYQRVMSGIVEETDTGWVARNYLNDIDPEDELPLTFDDQVCILDTWEYIKMALDQDEDPTDKFAR